MNKNFIVGQSNELMIDSKIYDLHNCYDYEGLLLTNFRTLELIFSPNKDHGKDNNPIRIHFEAVDYLEFSDNFGTSILYEVMEVGYKSPGDFDDNWLLTEKQSSGPDHIFFRFSENEFIRIYSKSAELREYVAVRSI